MAVGYNPSKFSLFSVDDRVAMLTDETRDLTNVRVDQFHGLVVDYVRSVAPAVIVRGLRDATDFSHEVQMAATNRAAGQGVETLFMPASPEYAWHASHLIRQIAEGGGDVRPFVTEAVAQRLAQILAAGDTP